MLHLLLHLEADPKAGLLVVVANRDRRRVDGRVRRGRATLGDAEGVEDCQDSIRRHGHHRRAVSLERGGDGETLQHFANNLVLVGVTLQRPLGAAL